MIVVLLDGKPLMIEGEQRVSRLSYVTDDDVDELLFKVLRDVNYSLDIGMEQLTNTDYFHYHLKSKLEALTNSYLEFILVVLNARWKCN